MTLRLALLLLLLVNGVLLAANTGVFGPEVSKAWFESEREPDRMRRQIRTEEIRILEPAPASAVAVPKSAPASTPAAASGAQASIERTALTTADTASSCTELSGLTDAQATRGLDQLKPLAGVRVERIARQEESRWWVHMPARDTREDAERKVGELKRRNVSDSAIVQEGNGFVVSLGVFRDKDRAQQRLDDLRAKDVRTAVLTETHRNAARTSLRVTTTGASADAASAVAAQLASLKKSLGAEDLHACAAVTASR